MQQLHTDETGISSLETAIILIAFIVSAAVFAFIILNTGTFSTERGQEAIYSGISEVSSALDLRGGMVALATTTGVTGTADSLVFTLSLVTHGAAIDLTDTGSGDNQVVISYRDERQQQENLDWSVEWLVHDGDPLLENNELVQITVADLGTQLSPPPGANSTFALQIKPTQGPALLLERTMPPVISEAMSLP